MRKPTDLCLLCRSAPADKKNSHILPRFISTDFLKEPGKSNRGYEIGSDTVKNKKQKVIQDSAKEDYILCTGCEEYFSALEGLAADSFNNWHKHLANGNYQEQVIVPQHLSTVNCGTGNSLYSRLLVYSMFWRTSISKHTLFVDYHLDPALEESLRNALMSVRATTRTDVIKNIAAARIPYHPYAVLTSHTFKDGTANILAAISDGNPASLNVDRFGFLLFPDIESLNPGIIRPFSNINAGDHQFMVVGEDLWHRVMVEMPIGMMVEQGKREKKM